jgi:hypothetical protein
MLMGIWVGGLMGDGVFWIWREGEEGKGVW